MLPPARVAGDHPPAAPLSARLTNARVTARAPWRGEPSARADGTAWWLLFNAREPAAGPHSPALSAAKPNVVGCEGCIQARSRRESSCNHTVGFTTGAIRSTAGQATRFLPDECWGAFRTRMLDQADQRCTTHKRGLHMGRYELVAKASHPGGLPCRGLELDGDGGHQPFRRMCKSAFLPCRTLSTSRSCTTSSTRC